MFNTEGIGILPAELAGMEVLETLVDPTASRLGILVMGDDLDSGKPTIRVYLLRKDDGLFNVEKELTAIGFNDKQSALIFADRLPKMTALQFMLLTNDVVAEDENTLYQ